MFRKRIQLGLLHVAVAMTLVPINSTLNRVMIKEFAISATLVALLASLPYLFSPIQMVIGAFADRHPLWGLRRTPYIFAGLLLCVVGVIASPLTAFLMVENLWAGVGLGVLTFGAWGMGYNLASVSYLSLASEISGEKGGRTVSIMFFMMITSIIITAIALSRMVDPYTAEAMQRAFLYVGLAALVLGLIGLVRLETRAEAGSVSSSDKRHTPKAILQEVTQNRQARLFFVYLTILLAALLGQDVLLEPFGGEAFGMSVRDTTRITSIWGGCMLVALMVAGLLEGRVNKRLIARLGGTVALGGFLLIGASGLNTSLSVFYSGVVLLGAGTGLSTTSNLSLMLQMITPGKVGLYMGAWGMANAFSRLTGSVLGGAVRDGVSQVAQNSLAGYVVVFGIEAALLLVSLFLLSQINVTAFQNRANQAGVIETAAMVNDGG